MRARARWRKSPLAHFPRSSYRNLMPTATRFELCFPRLIVVAATIALSSVNPSGATAMAAEGLITLKSQYQPKDTMERLESAVSERGLTIFARIDHGAGAAQVGLPLRPTELLIFGSPKGGTPIMQSAQTAGIGAGVAGR